MFCLPKTKIDIIDKYGQLCNKQTGIHDERTNQGKRCRLRHLEEPGTTVSTLIIHEFRKMCEKRLCKPNPRVYVTPTNGLTSARRRRYAE